MADQAKGKGIAPKRASNPADPGQSSRPLLPIRTLSEDKEDSKDYSEVIEVLKQYIKSYKRVIASQSSNIKTLLLSLNTLKASVEDSVSAIKNISSTLASLTNSSNATAATIGKTSYSPRFDPFSGTMDLDSPPRPPRKEPYLGPAVDNTATSNLDPPIDTGSKEGFKDTITSSIVKELSKKAYTIPDDSKLSGESNFEQWIQALSIVLRALGISNFLENPDISNTYSDSDQAVLLMLLRDSLSSGPKAAISRPIESKKEDLLALKGYKKRKDFKGKGLKTSSNKAKYKDNKPRRRPRDPALYNSWLYDTGSTDHISNSKERFTTFTPNTGQLRPINTGNGPISPAGIGSITLEVLSRKAPPTYTKLVLDNVLYLPNIDINIISGKSGFFLNVKGSSKPILHANFAFPLGLTSYNTTKSIEPQYNKIVVEIPSNSIRKEDYRPIIEDTIVSEAIEPNKRYKLRNSPAKGTTLEGVGPSLRGKRPYRPHVRLGHIGLRLLKKTSSITKGLPNFDKIKEADFHCSSYNRGPIVANAIKGFFRGLRNGFSRYPTKFHFDGGTEITDLLTTWLAKRGIKFSTSAPYIHEQNGLVERSVRVILDQRYRAIGAKGEAIIPLEKRSKSLKFTFRTEECKLLPVLGSKTYLVYILSRRAVLKTSTVKFIEDNTVLSQPTDNTALEGELVDLDLDLEGAVSPDPSNLNTEKPISIEIGPSKLEPYESSSDSELDEPSPDKPINPVIVESTRPTISIRKPELLEAFPQTIKPIFAPKPIEVIAPNQPIINEPLNNSDLISEGDKMQLDYYKLLAKTSSYILILPTWRILLAIGAVLDWEIEQADFIGVFLNSALREEIYMEIPEGLLDLAASNKAIYKLLLKYSYNPSTPNIIKLSKALYRVFYKAKTCHFIVTYVDNCLFIGPNIGYITDLKKRLNKVYAKEDLGPAAYFLGMQIIRDRPNRRLWLNQVDISFTVQWLSRSLNRPTKSYLNAAKNLFKYLNSTKDYSICFSCNGNTVADLGPKLSNSSNTTTKLSRDFHSKEGPRPLTTTSTTIVDSRNSKGSSRTSIINSSLVPIGFSDSDFAGDKATSKSTYGYLYKLAGRPISWKTKRATTIALSTLEAETNGLTEAIREVQWIIGLFSKLYRPIDYPITLYRDNQGSITVANDLALHARTKYTLLKFRYVREQVKAKIVTIIYLNTKCF
ncbi:hypothetical protein P8C59_001394 [Phyllachora maydis]|uniref:Integrase catalytic domain-containing protein n=1 Tax=Phyllachora maydis TaxID=1825666 RepID=A0AAD9MA69_9PEZI|nr:hypothetical protein P8C59_001394 [Phyllachora maydis]